MSPLGGFRAGRRRGLVAGAVVGSAVSRGNRRRRDEQQQQQQDYYEQQPSEAPAEPAEMSETQQIENLAELRDRGILTEEEFTAKKKRILGI